MLSVHNRLLEPTSGVSKIGEDSPGLTPINMQGIGPIGAGVGENNRTRPQPFTSRPLPARPEPPKLDEVSVAFAKLTVRETPPVDAEWLPHRLDGGCFAPLGSERPVQRRRSAPTLSHPVADAALIALDGVRRTFGSGRGACAALRGITLTVRRGEFVALAGPSGSGKSTLLHIIGGLDAPSSGTVCFQGRDLAAMSDTEISDLRLRHIGLVFQDAQLVPVLSVAENVELPLLYRRELGAAERKERVRGILERVELGGKEHRRPAELSGGERQRAALARALAGRPAITLADEPTASLDQETGAAMIKLMRDLNQECGTTFVYATHDPQLLTSADRLLKLRDGQLEETA